MIHETAVVSPEARIHPSAVIGPHVVIDGPVTIGKGVTVFPGAYIGKMPKIAGDIHILPKAVPGGSIGEGTVIGANAVIYAGHDIGESVLIGDGVTLRENATIGWGTVIGNNSTLQNNVLIGRRVRVVDLSHVTAYVVIEDDVFWSVGVTSMNDNSMARGGVLRPPYVERGARIGGGAQLLPGVRIGANAVVGAGSVVTHDVGHDRVVMGVPARERQPIPMSEADRLWREYYFGHENDY